MVDGDLRYDNLARKLTEEDIQHAVIAAYTNALKGPEDMRRRAFDAAPRVDRMPHAGISEAIARRRVALDARQLRYFIAVAEELSFTRAADRLNVAQSAVSLQIKGLEEAFGARLLNRRKRAAVSLTEAGRLFLSEAVAAIRQLERAEQVGHLAARGELGQIEVGYVASAVTNSDPVKSAAGIPPKPPCGAASLNSHGDAAAARRARRRSAGCGPDTASAQLRGRGGGPCDLSRSSLRGARRRPPTCAQPHPAGGGLGQRGFHRPSGRGKLRLRKPPGAAGGGR